MTDEIEQSALQTRGLDLRHHCILHQPVQGPGADIDNLPPEILIQVITHSLEPFSQDHCSRLRILSTVSKAWFKVVHGSPSLWAVFYTLQETRDHERAIQGMNGPLLVRFDERECTDALGAEVSGRRVGDILRQCTRWQDVAISVMAVGSLRTLQNQPTPVLDSLELAYVTPSVADGDQMVDVFKTPVPRLKKLSLTKLAIPWDSPILIGLHHLALYDLWDYPPSAGQLLNILRGSPRLLTLALRNMASKPGMVGDTEVVDLPELISLHIKEAPSTVSHQFILTISTPRCISYEFDFGPEDIGEPLLKSAATRLGSVIQSTQVDEIQLGFGWWRTAIEVPSTSPELPLFRFRFQLRYAVQSPQGLDNHVILRDDFQAALGQHPLKVVFIALHEQFEPGYIRALDTLAKLRTNNITTIVFGHKVIRSIPAVLEYLSHPRLDPDGSSPWPCPRLRRIEFDRCTYEDDDSRSVDDAMVALALMIRNRQDARKAVSDYDASSPAAMESVFLIWKDDETNGWKEPMLQGSLEKLHRLLKDCNITISIESEDPGRNLAVE